VALIVTKSFERSAEIFAAARFHFDKNQRVAIAADNVYFAAASSAKIAVENFVTVATKKFSRQFLAELAETDVVRLLGGREAVAPPVRKTGDGLGKVQVHAAWSGEVRCRNLCAD